MTIEVEVVHSEIPSGTSLSSTVTARQPSKLKQYGENTEYNSDMALITSAPSGRTAAGASSSKLARRIMPSEQEGHASLSGVCREALAWKFG